ncbi:UDP-N-acetylmuramate dehydrogenase [Zavarzinella formosa]|uniref:UDP-N-acetylmuramate dehydrogenase n=1 Tax=Zavarzinella formosa TaxID=360055 RepID=UPI0003183CDE|nr:UDP-N-acetylmuramate dehydrogenase [Zavarzinella formosa]
MAFRDQFADILRADQPLAPFTHLRIGGPAEYVVTPQTPAQLADVLKACRREKIPFRVMGDGTNLLIRDEGVRGVVVRLTAPEFASVKVDGKSVTVGGGAKLSHLIDTACRANLAGFETLVGIRATVGGAVRCNAGDRSGEIADNLVKLDVLDEAGQVRTRDRSEIRFGRHDSDLDDPVIFSLEFKLETDQPTAIAKRMRRAWINRRAEEPFLYQSAMRMFKNPSGRTAAEVIEEAGLVRSKSGNAEISDRNANYLIAQPGTTATDILSLLKSVRETVFQKTGVSLEQEINVW